MTATHTRLLHWLLCKGQWQVVSGGVRIWTIFLVLLCSLQHLLCLLHKEASHRCLVKAMQLGMA